MLSFHDNDECIPRFPSIESNEFFFRILPSFILARCDFIMIIVEVFLPRWVIIKHIALFYSEDPGGWAIIQQEY